MGSENSAVSATTTAILDIDGTLVDSNYQHTLAWYRALRENGVVIPIWRIHRHVGMGGDQLVRAVAGERVERERGDAVRRAEQEEYERMLPEVACFEGSWQLLSALRKRGHAIVLATSARPAEVEHYLDLLDARGLAQAWTTSADVRQTKPRPDLVLAAMARVQTDRAVLIGDATWDVIAARDAGVPAIGILTGGFSAQELRESGAVAVFESVLDLCRRIDDTDLGRT